MTIKTKDITIALVTHCKAATGWPVVVYENKDFDGSRPRVEFDNVRVSTTDRTIDGNAEVHRGYLQLTVVTDLNQFINEAEDFADLIRAHFPYPATRLEVTGGKIAVMKPPEALNGFRDRDAGEWRVPVRIDYTAQ